MLPVSRRTLESDAGLRQAQQYWHIMSIAICKGIQLVDSATQQLIELVASPDPISHQALLPICHRLSQDVAEPMGQALRMTTSKASDLQLRRHDKLVADIKDFTLGNAVKEPKLACD